MDLVHVSSFLNSFNHSDGFQPTGETRTGRIAIGDERAFSKHSTGITGKLFSPRSRVLSDHALAPKTLFTTALSNYGSVRKIRTMRAFLGSF